ncbi:permease [Niallia alba]|uniref:permease n=1 Tax=Niallia alba TaxID=2729105 RepID=UPI001F3220E6|nr:permease [Niallia alba]
MKDSEEVYIFLSTIPLKFYLNDCFNLFHILYPKYFPPERTKSLLGGSRGVKGNILGALLGTITPFCSCSSKPIFIGFTSAGLPLGVTFSFLISSAMVDLASFLILTSFFGVKIAAINVICWFNPCRNWRYKY